MSFRLNLMMKKTKGQIQLYTGDGKGKTTAGLGLAVRAAGNNKKVAIIFFDKGGNMYGERKVLKKIPNIDVFVTGEVRFRPGKPFRFSITEADKKEALKGLKLANQLYQKKYDLLILDEINTTVTLGMLKLKDVLELIEAKPEKLELVLTGRRAPKKLINRADLVTEMKPVKHYMYKGVPARKGIEF